MKCHGLIAGAAALSLALGVLFSPSLRAIENHLDADASDPAGLGWMQGSPPPPEKIITRTTPGYMFPRRRWTYSHYRELQPSANVWRGSGPATELPSAPQEIGGVRFTDADGEVRTWDDMLKLQYTDGILVMHKGKVVSERYFGALDADRPHIAMSMTKSFVGLMAAMLVDDDTIDEDALVPRYVPELEGTAYGDATVRQVMDMLTGIRYSEDYLDPNADVFVLAYASGVMPSAPGYTGPDNLYAYLVTNDKEGEHGQVFAYRSSNTQVLSWIMVRATGKPLARLLSDMIWQKLGAESDAYFTIDSIGTAYAAGGLNTTLRDLARFGEMIRVNGSYNGQQIVPTAVIEDIRRGGNRKKFAKSGSARQGYSYRNMWWISHDEHGAIWAFGFNGQRLYIDPKADVTIARYTSHHSADGEVIQPTTEAAFRAMAKYLMGLDD